MLSIDICKKSLKTKNILLQNKKYFNTEQIISTTFAQYYLAFSTEDIIGALSLFAIVMLYFPKPHNIYK